MMVPVCYPLPGLQVSPERSGFGKIRGFGKSGFGRIRQDSGLEDSEDSGFGNWGFVDSGFGIRGFGIR